METHVEILILGAGCAGLTAGLYAARTGAEVLILEKGLPGGQTALTASVENYPGVPGMDGASLMAQMERQATESGATILCTQALEVDPWNRRVRTEAGCFTADALILATGAEPRKLGIPGEAEFLGRGVSYCAACDGFFYRGKEIYVVGGGNSAGEEALHLAEIGSRVHLLVRSGSMRCDNAIRQRLLEHPRVELQLHRQLTQILGGERIQSLMLRNTETGEQELVSAEGCGVFVFIGYRPATELFRGKLEMDEEGYLLTDEHLCTGVPGVFAAGDVRRKQLRQIVTAAADGALAGIQACQFRAGLL